MDNVFEKRFNNEFINWDNRYKRPYKNVVNHEICTRRKLIDSFLEIKEDELKILEIGCGTANVISDIIDKHPTWKGYGIDISGNMIEYNNKRFPHISFKKVDLNKDIIWEGEKFDIVICAGVIGYLEDPQLVMNKIHSQLAKDGILLISYANKCSIFRKSRNFIINLMKFRFINSIIKKIHPSANSYNVLSQYKGYSSKEFLRFTEKYNLLDKKHYSFGAGFIPGWWIIQTKIFELITSNNWGPGRDILLRLKKSQ